MEYILVVRDFPSNLPKFPLIREVEFSIDLMTRIDPITKAPDYMIPVELIQFISRFKNF